MRLSQLAKFITYTAPRFPRLSTGANNLEETTHIREVLNHLLDKAQMAIRKWRSNSIELKGKDSRGFGRKG